MGWIPVEERTPREIIDLVLVARNKGNEAVMPARYVGGEFISCDGVNGLDNKAVFLEATHWMPLPKPPAH